MILLDTHIWVWWADESPQLRSTDADLISSNADAGLGISAFSLWEVAKLHQKGRLAFTIPLATWFVKALARPGIMVLPITPKIVLESISLPEPFHSDPADQVIVATARAHNCPLLTYDSKIRGYEHVQIAS